MNAAELNTPETKHYAAVLLSQLRQIKAATPEAAINGQLDQNIAGGGVAENQQNWLKADTNQASIEAHLTTVTESQLKVLEEYAAAAALDNAHGKGLV